jgi:tol-pal system protein YbgF
MTRPLGLLAVLLVVASGCATRASVRRVQADLGALRGELSGLRQAHDEHAHETTRSIEQLRALDGRLRGLGTAVGDTGDAVRRLAERVTALEGGVKDVRAQQTARVAAPPPPDPPRESPAREAPPREAPSREAPPRESPLLRSNGADAAYQAALATFRTREYGQAVLELLDFLAKFPRHPLAGSAQYWIGEAYYIQRDWRQALVEFEKVLTHNARDGKVADALLKIGLCYNNLREPVRAQQAWQRVLTEHADSDAAQKARGLLRAASGPSRR